MVPTGDKYYTLEQRGETKYGCEQLLVYDESQELGIESKKTEQHFTAVNKAREIPTPEAITEDEVVNINTSCTPPKPTAWDGESCHSTDGNLPGPGKGAREVVYTLPHLSFDIEKDKYVQELEAEIV